MKRFLTAMLILTMLTGRASAKKMLDHDAFDSWQSVRNYGFCNNGAWEGYSVDPQEGDGVLYLYNMKNGKKIALERGYDLRFTADNRWAVARIKPHYAATRAAKIKKKKDFDLPQDSLALINLTTGNVEKIPGVVSYKIGKDGGDWIAYQSCDTTLIKKKALSDKKAGKPMVVRHLPSGRQKIVKWVDNYLFDNNGDKLAFTLKKAKKDTLSTDGVGVILLPDTSLVLLDRDKKYYGEPVFSEKGDMLAYTLSNDTVETGTRRYNLYLTYLNKGFPTPELISVARYEHEAAQLMLPHSSDPAEQQRLEQERKEAMDKMRGQFLALNQYSRPIFSHNGKRLIIGIAPEIAPNDTAIVDFERADLDIWRWDAPMTPPQENINVKKLREKTFPVVFDLATMKSCLLNTAPLASVTAPDRWDSDWALLTDPTDNAIERQWNYTAPEKVYVVNVATGERRFVGDMSRYDVELSPCGKYVAWFKDRNFYCYEIATGEIRNVSAGVKYPLWDDTMDRPSAPEPYGRGFWSRDDQGLMVYDKYDIWRLDPQGKKAPECLTAGEGRKKGLQFRYHNTDRERRYVEDGMDILLDVFEYSTKQNGLSVFKYGKCAEPKVQVLDKYKYTQVAKARKGDSYSWQRANFSTSPDIWAVAGSVFAKARQLSNTNPQMADYYWGEARLVDWTTYDGHSSEGILYVPEDFDPEKKYPMLVVFYETNSENLYRHYTMEPSWSWVNYPFYVSRGYVVFVPDIHYTAGIPGECAYNYVCSGVEAMTERYPWIDKERIGIDGQSWGGYQTAYLVTRTNMFACAGSGAPVANMTSAFGGIRWESGDSRQAQYEQGQSRIGRNLWEAPQLYIANSPVFYANRVETPLLIMHNDNDGAVPWYQGIEMFMALRRLGKPVWMLQYNGESHNIKARKNRKDITIRLQQFFDHYLKDAPMPKWMKEGIPAVRKGQDMNYQID